MLPHSANKGTEGHTRNVYHINKGQLGKGCRECIVVRQRKLYQNKKDIAGISLQSLWKKRTDVRALYV